MKEKYIEYKRALQLQGGDINDNLIDEEEAQQSNRKSTQSKHTDKLEHFFIDHFACLKCVFVYFN